MIARLVANSYFFLFSVSLFTFCTKKQPKNTDQNGQDSGTKTVITVNTGELANVLYFHEMDAGMEKKYCLYLAQSERKYESIPFAQGKIEIPAARYFLEEAQRASEAGEQGTPARIFPILSEKANEKTLHYPFSKEEWDNGVKQIKAGAPSDKDNVFGMISRVTTYLGLGITAVRTAENTFHSLLTVSDPERQADLAQRADELNAKAKATLNLIQLPKLITQADLAAGLQMSEYSVDHRVARTDLVNEPVLSAMIAIARATDRNEKTHSCNDVQEIVNFLKRVIQ